MLNWSESPRMESGWRESTTSILRFVSRSDLFEMLENNQRTVNDQGLGSGSKSSIPEKHVVAKMFISNLETRIF